MEVETASAVELQITPSTETGGCWVGPAGSVLLGRSYWDCPAGTVAPPPLMSKQQVEPGPSGGSRPLVLRVS